MTSPDGITWSSTNVTGVPDNSWYDVCWSPELGLFVAVAYDGSNRIMTSYDGFNWTSRTSPNEYTAWVSVCWSPELGLFVAVAEAGTSGANRVMTSPDGTTWTGRTSANENSGWISVCWSPELGLFVAVSWSGSKRVMTSPNGINWTGRPSSNDEVNEWWDVCWSKELGIFVAVANRGTNKIMTSSLKGRPPTSYNVFDSSFNRIDENGKWDFSNINVTTLTVNNVYIGSDDRLKHNEVAITNGLDVIDRLTPKFYQKTQVLLDASYNGDLSGHAWYHEAGLIAQEVLQISDLSYVVGGGDYYEQTYNLITQTQDLSANYYDQSANYYEPSANNYELSNNYYDQSANNYEISANNYEISYNLIAQAYNLNYNSVFVYGLAAIKELHTKVKAQESTILNQKNIISSLLARIQALEI